MIDVNDIEKVPMLNDRELLRILDARSEDIGLGRIIKDDCSPDMHAALMNQFRGEATGLKLKKHDVADSGAI